MTSDQIIEKLQNAYNKLLEFDEYLISINASERSITYKLAEYLKQDFSGWDIDCEYNRNGSGSKKLISILKEMPSNNKKGYVYPDIIIHHRGKDDNLVVIEAKKNEYPGIDRDEEKLKAFIKELDYKFAFKITIGSDNPIKQVTL